MVPRPASSSSSRGSKPSGPRKPGAGKKGARPTGGARTARSAGGPSRGSGGSGPPTRSSSRSGSGSTAASGRRTAADRAPGARKPGTRKPGTRTPGDRTAGSGKPGSGKPGERTSGPRAPGARSAGAPAAGGRAPREAEGRSAPPPKGWGRLTRKGAERIDDPEARANAGERSTRPTGASGAWRSAMQSERGSRGAPGGLRHADGTKAAASGRSRAPEARAPEAWAPEEWVRDDPGLEQEAGRAVARGRASQRSSAGGTSRRAPASRAGAGRDDADIEAEVRAELASAVGNTKVDKFEVRLKDASRAFEAERFTDAARILKKLADEAPGAPSVRELYGVTLYRQGRWRLAARELEAFRVLTDSTEQHPVLADCYRALHQYGKVDELWQELRAASPSAELVTEGRIVAAGALADRGDAKGALSLLSSGFTFPKRPREHHLRRAYALADAYERVGDVARARDSFERIAAADPGFADTRQRIRNLR